jgi:C1A family cysteine protease
LLGGGAKGAGKSWLLGASVAGAARAAAGRALPTEQDLRKTFKKKGWPVEDQLSLGSCTAQAVVGLAEYLVYQKSKERLDLSRLFLYKVTRRILGWRGDTGAYIRTAIQAMAQFGVPPETYWPYNISRFEDEPEAFLYAFADEYRALAYMRLDDYGTTGEQTLDAVKRALCDGLPVAFGFPVYSSLNTNAADIPYPDVPDPDSAGEEGEEEEEGDKLIGGHAVLAVGYDDDRKVVFADGRRPVERGALIIRNSWGPLWGDEGYGYLPYRYVTEQMAVDFWTILHQDWLDAKQFQL